ncbi:MAG: 1,4-dihydroxy-2-naphthoate octaprenyltransferase [Halobacteriovorax sp.]|nr:1,4-dihydroxy-2-naphthoate octaprenyltransferase [Halobacteriovorax sp.]|tara:strand:- start:238151 stop:239035 length:885 start_codon:yes stop_codon:yes gene_type:complete
MISKSSAWLLATRPKTLPASIGPVLLGTSLASFEQIKTTLPIIILILINAVTLQIGTNLVNDYFDSVRGLDDHNRIGPDRALQMGWLTKEELKRGIIFVFTLAFVFGCFLMYIGGLPIVIIGLMSLLMAFMYTGGPLPLSYFGLGEVLAFIFFGPIPVWGTYFLITKDYDYFPAIVGCIPGLISLALMGINNLRDHLNDKEKGKKTLTTIFGTNFGRGLILFGAFFPNLLSVIFFLKFENYYFLTPILAFLAFSKIWLYVLKGKINSELNNSLAATGKFLFLTCLLNAIGFFSL